MTEKYDVKPEQVQALVDLEKLVGKTIPQVEEVVLKYFGVEVKDDNVIGLSLNTQQLTALPESIKKLTSLQSLFLGNNQLTTLPESIIKLKSLKQLDWNSNKLMTLPESITKLTSLQSLFLGNNQLMTLPESIGNLKSLQYLYLDDNQLTTLPESITKLTSLQELNLSGNHLSTLPESIGNLKSLQYLYLDDNQLTTLPESIGNLKSLQYLYLDDNQLTTLPESFSQLKSLEKIDLSSNNWKGEWQEMARKDIHQISRLKLCRKLYGIDIFISHAIKDQEDYPIIKLKKILEKCEEVHDVHLCEEDLRDSIQEFMNKNVLKSQLLIFVGTGNSLTSKDCLYELSLAKNFGIKILPIKGKHISRKDLKHIDLREYEQDFIDMSELEGFEFDAEVFNKLQEYITSHESELQLFKKEQDKFYNEKSKMRKIINDFADSNEYKELLKENFEDFQKIFKDVRNDRITTLEYILKLGQIIRKNN